MTKPRVKPLVCPFCGPMNGHYGFTIGRFGTRLTCFCCDSHGPRAATQEEAIAAWNTRTPDPAVQALVEAAMGYRSAIDAFDGTGLIDDKIDTLKAWRSALDAALAAF